MADGYLSAVVRANAAKQRRLGLMAATDRCARAYQRVQRSPRLRKYESILMQDWGGRHWEWVTYSTVKEIEAWAKKIKEDSDG